MRIEPRQQLPIAGPPAYIQSGKWHLVCAPPAISPKRAEREHTLGFPRCLSLSPSAQRAAARGATIRSHATASKSSRGSKMAEKDAK